MKREIFEIFLNEKEYKEGRLKKWSKLEIN